MLTEQDRKIRATRVTASTIAAFLGFHWYQSPSSAWALHTGLREFEENDNVRMGQFLEPGLVQAVTTRLGWGQYVYPCPTLIAADHAWAAATPDVVRSEHGEGWQNIDVGIQIKNQNSHMRKTYKGSPGAFGSSDNVALPPYMLAQCQWEMMVTGAERWYFATYLGGGDLWIFNLWRDQPMIDRLLERGHHFWREHLDPEGPRTEPSDGDWNPRVGRDPVRRKLAGAELLAQPIPKGGE